MELYLKTSGGLANLTIEGMLDLADLPETLTHRVEKVLVAETVIGHGAEGGPALPGLEGVDGMHYHLELVTETEVHTFEIDEADAPPEVLELVDELLYELNSRLRRERGKASSETATTGDADDEESSEP